jgi:TolB-like protein
LTTGRPAVTWRRPTLYAAVAVLSLLLVGLGAWRLWASASEPAPRVQVLNFRDAGGGGHTADLANYLVADIAGVLAQSGIQTVASRPAGEVRLNRRRADLQIGGVVRAEGARLKVRVFLNDPRAGVVLWSHEFDRPTAEIDQLRLQVGVATAETMYTVLEPLQQKGLHLHPEVLALHLRASEAMKTFNRLLAGEALRLNEQVVARAPDFAGGHGNLAVNLASVGRTNPDPTSADSLALLARAEAEAKLAIRLDTASAGSAYDALQALQRHRAPHDLVKVEDVLLDGLRNAPEHPFLHMRECRLLTEVGRARAAIRVCERALALRPFAGPIGHSHASAIYVAGQEELAREAISLAALRHPGNLPTRYRRFQIFALSGSAEEAQALLEDSQTRPGEILQGANPALTAYFLARRTRTAADTRTAVDLLRAAGAANAIPPDLAIRMIAALGETAAAVEMLSDPRFNIDASGGGFLLEPSAVAVRRDPQFWRIAARAGLVDYWTRRGAWPDFCGTEIPLATCKSRAAVAVREVPAPLASRVDMSESAVRSH